MTALASWRLGGSCPDRRPPARNEVMELRTEPATWAEPARAALPHATKQGAGRTPTRTTAGGSPAEFDGIALPPGPYRPPSPDDCDDGDPCTRNDCLVADDCRGDPFACDDGNSKTTDECTGQGCLFRLKPGVTRPAIE